MIQVCQTYCINPKFQTKDKRQTELGLTKSKRQAESYNFKLSKAVQKAIQAIKQVQNAVNKKQKIWKKEIRSMQRKICIASNIKITSLSSQVAFSENSTSKQ